MIKIIAIGKKHESWVQAGIERYQKRLRAPWNVEWILLPHSSLDGLQARQEESRRILSRLPADSHMILLDETGKQYSSPEVTILLEQNFTDSHDVTLVIGGAYGVDETIQQRAASSWSLSKLVFPHQLVRLLLIEQIYRAQSIASGHGYHHQ